MRFAACDTVIFLDMPRLLCLWRIIKRWFQFHGQTRPDMAEGCNEKLALELIKYALNYPITRRRVILERQSALHEDKQIVVLKSRGQVEDFFLRHR